MPLHIRHSGEAHPAVVVIFLERVDNVTPGLPHYLKFNYKRQNSKTKARVADELGTAMFNHTVVLHTTLYEKAAPQPAGSPARRRGQEYDPKILQLRLKQSDLGPAGSFSTPVRSGPTVQVSNHGTVQGGHIAGRLLCDTAMNLVEHLHPFNTKLRVELPLTELEEEGPMLAMDIKCTLVHARRIGPRHICDGAWLGGKHLLRAFAYALIGLCWDPYINTKVYGAAGLLKGLAKGLFGLAARPAIGVVQWFVYTAAGIIKTPGTVLKACCLSKAAREDKVIQKFKQQFPKFSLKELGALHEQFLDMSEGGEWLTRAAFMQAFDVVGMQESLIANRLFDQFAGTGQNRITISQFLTAMYIMMQGSVEDKLAFAFDMYDIDGNGTISEDEVNQLFAEMDREFVSMHLTSSSMVLPSMRQVFSELHQGNEIDKQQFINGMMSSPEIVKRLGFADSSQKKLQVARKGVSVGFMSRSWHMMLKMMLGIKKSVITKDNHRPLTTQDFEQKRVIALPSQELPPHMSDEQEEQLSTLYEFCDYGGMAFAQIREAFNISPDEYVASLGPEGLMSSLLLGNLCSLSEIMSEGKSGSFFYFSHDMRFMVKTISMEEFFKFRQVLPMYHKHVTEHPNTLLSRLLGLYKLKITDTLNNSVQRCFFFVMNNLFYTDRPPHRRYDLKGSTQGRISTLEERQENSVALKDLDFIDSPADKLMLPDRVREELLRTVVQDSDLLAQMKIMDYSLLLGIHELDPPDCELIHDPSAPCFERDSGGIRSVNPDGSPGRFVYFVGIIDILIPYSARKAAEHVAKSLVYDPFHISAVPPDDYAQRFQDFIREVVVPDPAALAVDPLAITELGGAGPEGQADDAMQIEIAGDDPASAAASQV